MSVSIGTLGQKVPWDITNTDTYQYPLSPKDVLLDPFIPTLSQMDDKYDELGGGGEGRKTVISDVESDSAEEDDKVIHFNDIVDLY